MLRQTSFYKDLMAINEVAQVVSYPTPTPLINIVTLAMPEFWSRLMQTKHVVQNLSAASPFCTTISPLYYCILCDQDGPTSLFNSSFYRKKCLLACLFLSNFSEILRPGSDRSGYQVHILSTAQYLPLSAFPGKAFLRIPSITKHSTSVSQEWAIMSSLGSLSVGSPQGLMLLYGHLTCRSGGHERLSKTVQNDMLRGKQTCISRMASLNNRSCHISSKDFFSRTVAKMKWVVEGGNQLVGPWKSVGMIHPLYCTAPSFWAAKS